MRNRTIQIKLVRDEVPKFDIPRPQNPMNDPETKIIEVAQQVTGCVVVGYTVIKSVDFFFRMAEHVIVNK